MTSVFDIFLRSRTMKKGGAGLPPRRMRDALLTEHLGPAMLAKLNQIYRLRKGRGA